MVTDGGHRSATEARVAGRLVACFLDGVEGSSLDRATAERRLADGGIETVHPDEWYPLGALCEAVEDLVETAGADPVVAAGKRCGERATADAGTVPDALVALDAAYRRGHRGDAGGYGFRQIGPTDGRVECSTPYPCTLDRAVVGGAAVAATDGFVRLAEASTCRDDGADRCTYELSW